MAHQVDAAQVDVENVVPGRLVEVAKVAVGHDAGVVEDDVEAAEGRPRQLDRATRCRRLGHVPLMGDDTPVRHRHRGRHPGQALAVAVDQHQLGPLLGKDLGRPRADPGCRPGDDGDLVA